MSLIFKNEITLKNIAIIPILKATGKTIVTRDGDFVKIKSVSGTLLGINIFNSEKYFSKPIEGVRTLSDEERKIIKNYVPSYDDQYISFQVGEVISRENHPKSEKLFVLEMMTTKKLKIVTNSLNSLVGKKVVVANINSFLPSGLFIEESKVMGIKSDGMLCGGETLQQPKTDGVYIVDSKYKVGDEFIIHNQNKGEN